MKRTVLILLAGLVCFNSLVHAQETKHINAVRNPVINSDFPDPTVIKAADGKFYAYATQTKQNGKWINIQVAFSINGYNWQVLGDALPVKPVWASHTQDFWAPDVLYDSATRQYVLYYSAESDDINTGKCIGVAFSAAPQGPFKPNATPLVSGDGFVNIDPMAFVDPVTHKKLLYWGSGFKPIKVQELTDDWQGFKPGTTAKEVVFPGKDKDYSILVEGAWVDYNNSYYYLYYSGDNCCGERAKYAVMVARANNPFGPFTRLSEATGTGNSAILEKDSTWLAPGHNSVFMDDMGKLWIAYHAVLQTRAKAHAPFERVMCINPLVYKNGWPLVEKRY